MKKYSLARKSPSIKIIPKGKTHPKTKIQWKHTGYKVKIFFCEQNTPSGSQQNIVEGFSYTIEEGHLKECKKPQHKSLDILSLKIDVERCFFEFRNLHPPR